MESNFNLPVAKIDDKGMLLPLPKTIIENSERPPSIVAGVYFLIKDERVIYIGRSFDVVSEVRFQINYGAEFDSYSTLSFSMEAPDEIMAIAQAWYIIKMKPKLNSDVPKNPIFMGFADFLKELLEKGVSRENVGVVAEAVYLKKLKILGRFRGRPYVDAAEMHQAAKDLNLLGQD